MAIERRARKSLRQSACRAETGVTRLHRGEPTNDTQRSAQRGSVGCLSALAVLAPIGRLGRYDLLGKLATGGVAEIYLGRMTGPNGVSRIVVIKRLNPVLATNSVVQRDFLHEAKLMLGLSHPNLATVYDVGEEDGALFLAMEWVRGPSLRRILDAARRRDGLPISLVVALFVDLAAALSHVHTASDAAGRPLHIVHRDVTPENVVVGWSGRPKLLDFGVAKSNAAAKQTDAGVVKGKYAYMAPEQWGGEPVDARSDLFALAASLHEALTGTPLFERPTPMATMAAIVLHDPPSPPSAHRPEVPAELDRIVQRGLAREPADRHASAEELRAELAALEATLEPNVDHGARDRRLAAFLRTLFPGEADREPTLDRKPPSMRFSVEPTREPTPIDLQLQAEAELEGDAMLRDQRSRQRTIALLVALIVVGTLAFVVVNLR